VIRPQLSGVKRHAWARLTELQSRLSDRRGFDGVSWRTPRERSSEVSQRGRAKGGASGEISPDAACRIATTCTCTTAISVKEHTAWLVFSPAFCVAAAGT